MVFNVLMILFIGCALERAVGSARLVAVYVMSGTVGIVASVLLLPELVSSGASQALMGIAAGSLLLLRRGHRSPRWLRPMAIATVGIQLVLDLVVAQFPKPGHVAGFLAGLLLGAVFVPQHSSGAPDPDGGDSRAPHAA